MIHNFCIPTIEDTTDFAKIPTKPLDPDVIEILKKATENRKQFKIALNQIYLKNKAYGESFAAYKAIAESYLATNADVLRHLGKESTAPIKITWKTFIDKRNKTFTPKGDNEEALAIELIMVRYSYAFAFYSEAEPLINQVRDKLATTFKSNSLMEEGYKKTIQDALELYYIGWEKIRKLHSVIQLVSKSIIMQKGYCIEAKGNTLDVVKNILEINANSLYIETLRLNKEYEQIAKVCNGNICRLQQASYLLESEKANIDEELLGFIAMGIKFYKALGMWSLINHYEILIKREEYTKKDFRRLTLEILCMSEQALQISKEIRSYKPLNKNIVFVQTYLVILEPVFADGYNLYKGIHATSEKLDGSKCLNEIGDENYLERMFTSGYSK